MGPPTTIKPATLQSVNRPLKKVPPPTKPRTSTAGTRPPAAKPKMTSGQTLRSPHINEEGEDDIFGSGNPLQQTAVDGYPEGTSYIDPTAALSPTLSTASRKLSISRSPGITSGLESKAASLKESEQYKAKIRTLERKILEQREQVKASGALQAEKEEAGKCVASPTNQAEGYDTSED